jgi:hypothetical protein
VWCNASLQTSATNVRDDAVHPLLYACSRLAIECDEQRFDLITNVADAELDRLQARRVSQMKHSSTTRRHSSEPYVDKVSRIVSRVVVRKTATVTGL